MSPSVGQRLANRYVLHASIPVSDSNLYAFSSTDLVTNLPVVISGLYGSLYDKNTVQLRSYFEKLAVLTDPRIPPALSYEIDSGDPRQVPVQPFHFIVQPHIEGESLAQAKLPWTTEQIRDITEFILVLLVGLHTRHLFGIHITETHVLRIGDGYTLAAPTFTRFDASTATDDLRSVAHLAAKLLGIANHEFPELRQRPFAPVRRKAGILLEFINKVLDPALDGTIFSVHDLLNELRGAPGNARYAYVRPTPVLLDHYHKLDGLFEVHKRGAPGKSHTTILSGPPGCGHTRFLKTLMSRLQLEGFSTFLIEPILFTDNNSMDIQTILRFIQSLNPPGNVPPSEVLPGPFPTIHEPPLTTATKILSAEIERVTQSATGPVMLLIDDFDRLDVFSRNVLLSLSSQLQTSAFSLVLTEKSPAWEVDSSLATDASARRILLSTLSEGDVQKFSESVLGSGCIPGGEILTELVLLTEGGLPRPLMALLQKLQQRGVAHITLQDLEIGKKARLLPSSASPERFVLQALTILLDAAPLTLLIDLASEIVQHDPPEVSLPLSETAVTGTLNRLVGDGIVECFRPEGQEECVYRLKAGVFFQPPTVDAQLSVRLHQQAFGYYEHDRTIGRPVAAGTFVHHAKGAQDSIRLKTSLREAIDEADRQEKFHLALDFLNQLIDVINHEVNGVRFKLGLGQLQLQKADLEYRIREYDSAITTLVAAEENVQSNDLLLSKLLESKGRVLQAKLNYSLSIKFLEEALRLRPSGSSRASVLLLLVNAVLCQSEFNKKQLLDAATHLKLAAEAGIKGGTLDDLNYHLYVAQLLIIWRERYGASSPVELKHYDIERILNRSREIAERLNRNDTVLSALSMQCRWQLAQNRLQSAAILAREAVDQARKMFSGHHIALNLLNFCEILFWQEKNEEALSIAFQAEAILQRSNQVRVQIEALLIIAETLLTLHRLEEFDAVIFRLESIEDTAFSWNQHPELQYWYELLCLRKQLIELTAADPLPKLQLLWKMLIKFRPVQAFFAKECELNWHLQHNDLDAVFRTHEEILEEINQRGWEHYSIRPVVQPLIELYQRLSAHLAPIPTAKPDSTDTAQKEQERPILVAPRDATSDPWLVNVLSALGSATSLPEIVDILGSALKAHWGAGRVMLAVADSSENLQPFCYQIVSHRMRRIPLEIANRAFAEKKAFTNANAEIDFSNQVMCFPLLWQNRAVGALYMDRPTGTAENATDIPKHIELINTTLGWQIAALMAPPPLVSVKELGNMEASDSQSDGKIRTHNELNQAPDPGPPPPLSASLHEVKGWYEDHRQKRIQQLMEIHGTINKVAAILQCDRVSIYNILHR